MHVTSLRGQAGGMPNNLGKGGKKSSPGSSESPGIEEATCKGAKTHKIKL